RGFSKAAIEAVEKGGIKVLREALQKEGTQVLKAFLMKQGASIAAEGATLFTLGTVQSFVMNPEATVQSFSSIGGSVDQLFESITKAAVYRVIGAGGARIMGRNPTVARILMQETVSGLGGAGVEAAGMAMKGEKEQITGKWLAYSLIQNAVQSGFMGVGRKVVGHGGEAHTEARGEINSQQLIQNFSLSDAERPMKAVELLGRELTEAQKKALIDAHNVGDERVQAELAKKGKKLSDLSPEELKSLYKIGELKAKYKILLEAGYSRQEAAKILREGIAGGVASEQTARGAKGKEASWLSRIFGSDTKEIDSMNTKVFPRGTEFLIGQPPKRYEVAGFEKGKIKLRGAAHEMAFFLTADELRSQGSEIKAPTKEVEIPQPREPRLPQSFSETPGFRGGDRINLPGSKYNGLYIGSEMPDGSVMIAYNQPVSGGAMMFERTSWSEILRGVKVGNDYVIRVEKNSVIIGNHDPNHPIDLKKQQRVYGWPIPLSEVLDQLRDKSIPWEQKASVEKAAPAVQDNLVKGQEVYIKRGNGVVEKGWVIEAINRDGSYCVINREQNVRRPKVRQNLVNPENNQIWSKDRIEKGIDKNDTLGSDAAAFERNKNAVLKTQTLLSKQGFDQFFGNWKMKQDNVGNCYMVSAINSLRQSPYFEYFVRTSMRKGNNGWEVHIPMGDKNAKPILVNEADLQPQKNPNYGKVDKKGRTDKRKFLLPMDGPIGFQVLEAALIKKVTFGENKPINRIEAEGGFGHQAILELFGKNFNKVKIDGNQGLDTGAGYGMTALQYGEAPAFNKGPKKVITDLVNFLNDFHPAKYLATANSPPAAKGDSSRFKIPGINVEFANSHAYSIVNVDKSNQTVSVANPWDTGKTIVLTYTQFASVFSQISAAEINYSKIISK
ncbi:hypothetical protein KKA13_02795, partial [Patescibacteria group bacterium]|nr:hypothetical protein [Patescibacteria group bacterium]